MTYTIGEYCSTCHYCYNECPSGAIRFVGREYAIDPDKCTSCGSCAEVCPSGIISDSEDRESVVPHAPEAIDCDLVVIGAGGSGLVAAVRFAMAHGKRVVVLEKAPKVGGNTNLSHGFVLRWSKRHEQAGMPDLREEAIRILGSTGQLSLPLLRKAMYGVTDMFDWLTQFGDTEDKFQLVDLASRGITQMGPFPAMPGMLDFPKRTQNVKSTDDSMGPGWAGTFVVEKMIEQCDELHIPVLTSHRAVELLVDDQGVFRGVRAENPGGEVVVNARVCLLASGSFSRNKEIMDRVRPTFNQDMPVHSFSVASNTGDAVGMVRRIGGKLDLDQVKIPMFSPTHHPYSFSLVRLAEDPRAIQVNIEGKRYCNEAERQHSDELKGPLENQPRHMAYALFDADTVEAAGRALTERPGINDEMNRCMTPWREALEMECQLDMAAKKADSIAQLAELTGIAPAALAKEIERYNSSCQSGLDKYFDKPASMLMPLRNPPFYALLLTRFNEGAVGGVVNDDNLRVLRQDGTPFSGLFAVGDCCRGLLKVDDNGGKFGELPWAMASGHIVADEIAEYLK
jgi:fumarate reductase flavoprotein subunit